MGGTTNTFNLSKYNRLGKPTWLVCFLCVREKLLRCLAWLLIQELKSESTPACYSIQTVASIPILPLLLNLVTPWERIECFENLNRHISNWLTCTRTWLGSFWKYKLTCNFIHASLLHFKSSLVYCLDFWI